MTDDISRKLLEDQENEKLRKSGSNGGNGDGHNDVEMHAQKIPQEVIFDIMKRGIRHKIYLQKYSADNLLAESIIIGDVPYFAVSRLEANGEVKLTLESSITVGEAQEYRPFEKDAYLNNPYWFKSKEHFESSINSARSETLDTVYRKVKFIWTKYIDADDFHISICAADTIFTYYQDKIGMTHYLFFVGGNDSGKSNNLLILKYLAYRNFTSTDMTAANIYTFLGSGEEGQGTLCEDEADRIDEDRQKMAIHKNGYIMGFPVSRIDTSSGRKQLKYNTYCWKAFAAERFLDPISAKGLITRTIELPCYAGDPEHDIAEVTDKTGAEEFQELKDELNEIHNDLLVFRLLHFHDKIPDVKLNIKRREKQLFKPIIRIFQDRKTLDELLPVISKYVTQRREANYSTLHAFLYRVIKDIIKSRKTSRIESGFIWDFIKSTLQGAEIPGKTLSYDTSEFGVISQKEIIQTLEHVFGAKPKKSHGIRFLDFDRSKLQRLGNVYDLATEVKVIKDGDDSFEQNRGTDWTDWTHVGLGKHMSEDLSDEEIKNNEVENDSNYSIGDQNNENITPDNDSKEGGHPVHSSYAADPTPEVEEDNAAKLREYDRLSALARKKSKDIPQDKEWEVRQ
jgi:hypothetical protein